MCCGIYDLEDIGHLDGIILAEAWFPDLGRFEPASLLPSRIPLILCSPPIFLLPMDVDERALIILRRRSSYLQYKPRPPTLYSDLDLSQPLVDTLESTMDIYNTNSPWSHHAYTQQNTSCGMRKPWETGPCSQNYHMRAVETDNDGTTLDMRLQHSRRRCSGTFTFSDSDVEDAVWTQPIEVQERMERGSNMADYLLLTTFAKRSCSSHSTSIIKIFYDMSIMTDNGHHDARTHEGIARSHPNSEARVEEGVQPSQPHAREFECATGGVLSAVFGGSSEDCESGVTERVTVHDDPEVSCDVAALVALSASGFSVNDSTCALTAEPFFGELALVANDIASTIESIISTATSTDSVCSIMDSIAGDDLASDLAGPCGTDEPHLKVPTSEDMGERNGETLSAKDGVGRTRGAIQQDLHTLSASPSNDDRGDIKRTATKKLVSFTPEWMDRIKHMEMKFHADTADWHARKRILDRDLSIVVTPPDEDSLKAERSFEPEEVYSSTRKPRPIGSSHGAKAYIAVDFQQDATNPDVMDSREVPDDWVQQIVKRGNAERARLKAARKLPLVAPVAVPARDLSPRAIGDTEKELSKLWGTVMNENLGTKATGARPEGYNAAAISVGRGCNKLLLRSPVPLAVRGLKIARLAGAQGESTSCILSQAVACQKDLQTQEVPERTPEVPENHTLDSSSSDIEDWLEDFCSGSGALVQPGPCSSFVVEEGLAGPVSVSSSPTPTPPVTLTCGPFPILVSDILPVDHQLHALNPLSAKKTSTVLAPPISAAAIFKSRRSSQDAPERQARLASARKSLIPPTLFRKKGLASSSDDANTASSEQDSISERRAPNISALRTLKTANIPATNRTCELRRLHMVNKLLSHAGGHSVTLSFQAGLVQRGGRSISVTVRLVSRYECAYKTTATRMERAILSDPCGIIRAI
ncbi:hypothetical protein BDV93DRAFT_592244 [Ceratobasidium sp. AG-I]|nr:hypothetical protein BDV93DRAFT_592244 [Ceratobasidium sp. AG-I]